MANNQSTGLYDKIRYYIGENKQTRPFFNPRLLIIPGGIAVFFIIMSGGNPRYIFSSVVFFFYLLGLEWLVLYLVIMYRRAISIIENQKKIIQILEEIKMSP